MPSCPFCEQTGLPILPVRHALAHQGGAADAPRLSAPFQQSIALPTDRGGQPVDAHYTLRLLRHGYLYVFDEGNGADGYWSAYVVTPEGYLFEFDIEDKTPPDVSGKYPCKRGADPYRARCITVPDIQSATRLWLGFTDTAWTPAVLDKHQDAAYRNAHMTCIDVQKWLTGSDTQDNVTSLETVAERVAEFAPGCQGGKAAREGLDALLAENDHGLPSTIKRRQMVRNRAAIPFAFVTDELQQLAEQAEPLSTWARQQGEDTVKQAQNAGLSEITCGTPMLVAVQDPVGIAMDLNGLIVQLLDEWEALKGEDRLWKQVTSKSIQALEAVVKSQAVKHRRQHYYNEFMLRYTPEDSKSGSGTTLYRQDAQAAAQTYAERFTRHMADSLRREQEKARRVKQYHDIYAPQGGYVAEDEIQQRRQQYIREKMVADGGIEHIENEAWASYTGLGAWDGEPLYDEARRKRDDAAFQAALTAYDQNHVTSLSAAWLACVQSDIFTATFTHNHDPADINSGMSFVTLITLVAHGATGRADVKAFIARELAKNPTNAVNIWIRALALNQDRLTEELDAGRVDLQHPGSFAAQGAQFLAGIAELGKPEQQAEAGKQAEKTRQWLAARQAQLVPMQNRIAGFMRETGGAMLEALGELPQDLVLSHVQNRMLTAMAGAGYDPSAVHYLWLQQAMLTQEQKFGFITRVLQQVTAAPNSPAPAQIKHAIREARVAIQGEDNTAPQPMRGLAQMTQERADKLGLATQIGAAEGKAGQWHVPAEATGDVDAATFTRTQAASARLVTVDSAAFHVGVVGMLLSTWSFAGMARQESIASAGKATHLAVAAGTLAGQYMEVTGAVLQDTRWGSATLSKPLDNQFIEATTRAEKLAGFGRIVGAVGGFFLGVWQAIKGIQGFDENQSLAWFNITTGGATAVLSALILGGILVGLAFALLTVLAIVAFIWHFFVNDKYQNWLTRCYYGAGPNKFENMVDQQAAFHRITTSNKTSEEQKGDPAKAHLYYGYRQIRGVS